MFLHRLAFRLGKTVGELRRELTGTQLADWMAYFELEPPEKTGWQQSAMICLTAARIAGDKRTNLEDFMPAYAPHEMAPEDMIGKLRELTKQPGG